jgi:hypothetical protein
MRYGLFALVLIAGLWCSQAGAQSINGVYTFRLTSNCQATIQMKKSTGSFSGFVVDLAMSVPGKLEENIGTATFNASTHRVRIVGLSIFGDLVRIAGKPGTAMKQAALSFDWPYSNTTTTLTLNGQVYRMVVGNIVSGIARNVYFQRLAGNCVINGSAVFR